MDFKWALSVLPGLLLEAGPIHSSSTFVCPEQSLSPLICTPADVWLPALKCISLFVHPHLCCSAPGGLGCWLLLLGQPWQSLCLDVAHLLICPEMLIFCLLSLWLYLFFVCGSWPSCGLICCMQCFFLSWLYTLGYKLYSEFSIPQGCNGKPVECRRNLLLTSMGH